VKTFFHLFAHQFSDHHLQGSKLWKIICTTS